MADNATKKKGRAAGSGKRYNFPLLLSSIKKIMPVCSSEWAAVAEIYQKDSKEAKRRDGGELKRTFYNNKKMCNKHKAPTGTSDDATFVKECINLAKDLGDKEHKGLAGGSDSEDGDEDEDDNDDDNEEDDEVEVEAEDAGANDDEPEASLEGVAGGSGKKRKVVHATTSTPKTKNSKVTGSTGSSEGSRQGTSSIIKNIGESVSSMAQQSMIEMMMAQQQSQAQQQTQMFMQMMQQQQQAAQTAQQQQQQTMMQLMMMMMGGGRANLERSSSSSRSPHSNFPNFSLEEEDDRQGI